MKDLFLLMAFVRGLPSPSFLACGEAGHHGRQHVGDKAAHLLVARKKKGGGDKISPSSTPQLLAPTRLHLLVSTTSSSVLSWEPSLQPINPWGTVQTQTVTHCKKICDGVMP